MGGVPANHVWLREGTCVEYQTTELKMFFYSKLRYGDSAFISGSFRWETKIIQAKPNASILDILVLKESWVLGNPYAKFKRLVTACNALIQAAWIRIFHHFQGPRRKCVRWMAIVYPFIDNPRRQGTYKRVALIMGDMILWMILQSGW